MVKGAAVVDCACLIGLERIGCLDLLPALIDPVMTPPAVESEFGPLPPWVEVRKPEDAGMVAALRLVLDAGESEAIALAYQTRTRIILDDRKAREVARRLGLSITGTVGLILKAKQSGVIPKVRPILEALEANQFHVGDALRVEALRLAGE